MLGPEEGPGRFLTRAGVISFFRVSLAWASVLKVSSVCLSFPCIKQGYLPCSVMATRSWGPLDCPIGAHALGYGTSGASVLPSPLLQAGPPLKWSHQNAEGCQHQAIQGFRPQLCPLLSNGTGDRPSHPPPQGPRLYIGSGGTHVTRTWGFRETLLQ